MVSSDWAFRIAILAILVVLVQNMRIIRKNRRLRQLADEANNARRQAEATEQRNRQLKQEMTSNIAHELKTPLSAISGYLEILLSDKPIDEAQRHHFLQRCYSQTQRLGELVRDVSLINKLEESADLFPRTDIDASTIAIEAFVELSEFAQNRGISLENHLPSPLPLTGNSQLLYAIFRNLTENAIFYAGDGVKVVVETYEPQTLTPSNATLSTHYFIHFYDTGTGVTDEFLSRLFDRFARNDSGRSRQQGGTGLGLSIVKHAVLFHGGDIYAKNRPEGGLEFFFSLKKQ